MCQEMQADMDRKLQEECEQMATVLKRNMEEDLHKKKLEKEGEHMKGEVEKMFQEQMAAIMTRIQQGPVCARLLVFSSCILLQSCLVPCDAIEEVPLLFGFHVSVLYPLCQV